MRLLLDTHVLLWAVGASPRLKSAIRATISDADNTVFVSAVSAWELAIKSSVGKARFPSDIERWLPLELERSRFRELPITMLHAAAVERLPGHHGDPFDRMLIAQARAEHLTLVTADRMFRKYPVRILRA